MQIVNELVHNDNFVFLMEPDAIWFKNLDETKLFNEKVDLITFVNDNVTNHK